MESAAYSEQSHQIIYRSAFHIYNEHLHYPYTFCFCLVNNSFDKKKFISNHKHSGLVGIKTKETGFINTMTYNLCITKTYWKYNNYRRMLNKQMTVV